MDSRSKKLHMEKHYEGSNILFKEFGVHWNSSQIYMAFSNIPDGSNILMDHNRFWI